MACAECCRCCHEPPEGTTPEQVRLTRDLAKLAGVAPFFSRWGKYKPHAYATGGSRSAKTPSGSWVKAHVWSTPVNFDDSENGRMVSVDATMTADDALAVFKVLWHRRAGAKRRRKKSQPSQPPRKRRGR